MARILRAILASILILSSSANGGTLSDHQRQEFLKRFARGYYRGRSGQLFVVPTQGHFISGSDRTRYYFMHGSPWEHDSSIPLLFYGPDFVEPREDSKTRARQQDVLATLATFLHLEDLPATVTGQDLQVRKPGADSLPGIVAVIVLDGMRADYLVLPDSVIPNLSRLRARGTWFRNAYIDYLPTNTAVGHSSIATGSDPRFHGIAGNKMYDVVNRKPVEPYSGGSPDLLVLPTLGDLWNAKTRGKAITLVQGGNIKAGTALAGHGACSFNGKNGKDVRLVAYEEKTGEWTGPGSGSCFVLPKAVPDSTAWKMLRRECAGNRAGIRMDDAKEDAKDVRHCPAFARFEGDVAVAMIDSEAVGDDSIPDLILINLKTLDFVGHSYGPDSPEVRDAIRAVDSQVQRIVDAIAASTKERGFVVAITADHGMPSGNLEQAGLDERRHTTAEILARLNEDEPDKPALQYESEDAQIYIRTEGARTAEYFARKLRSLPYFAAVFTEEEVRRAAQELD